MNTKIHIFVSFITPYYNKYPKLPFLNVQILLARNSSIIKQPLRLTANGGH